MKIAWDKSKLKTVFVFKDIEEMYWMMKQISNITKTDWEIFDRGVTGEIWDLLGRKVYPRKAIEYKKRAEKKWVALEDVEKMIEQVCHKLGNPDFNDENHIIGIDGMHWKQLAEHFTKRLGEEEKNEKNNRTTVKGSRR